MVACEQTPLPSGKIGQGAPSPIFPERRGGGGLYTGYTVVMERGVPSTLPWPWLTKTRGGGGGSVHRLHCGDGERSTFNFALNLANKNPGYPPPRPLRQLG